MYIKLAVHWSVIKSIVVHPLTHNYNTVFVECANDLTIENGIVSYPDINSVGAVATYTCNDDYFLMGDRERVCQLNATWSGSPPTCGEC